MKKILLIMIVLIVLTACNYETSNEEDRDFEVEYIYELGSKALHFASNNNTDLYIGLEREVSALVKLDFENNTAETFQVPGPIYDIAFYGSKIIYTTGDFIYVFDMYGKKRYEIETLISISNCYTLASYNEYVIAGNGEGLIQYFKFDNDEITYLGDEYLPSNTEMILNLELNDEILYVHSSNEVYSGISKLQVNFEEMQTNLINSTNYLGEANSLTVHGDHLYCSSDNGLKVIEENSFTIEEFLSLDDIQKCIPLENNFLIQTAANGFYFCNEIFEIEKAQFVNGEVNDIIFFRNRIVVEEETILKIIIEN